MSGKKLIFFTHSFPWDRREHFIDTELKYLSKKFKHITIIPMTNGGVRNKRCTPYNVTIKPFLISWNRLAMLAQGLFNLSPIGFYISEVFENKVFRRLIHLKNCTIASLQIRAMLAHPVIKEVCQDYNSRDVFYFNWGNGPGFLAPFLARKLGQKVHVRFHGGDLYEERSGGYIPYRKLLLKHLKSAIFISKNGQNYLHKKYPEIDFTSKVFRLGIEPIRESVSENRGKTLRMVSCSDLLPVKRVSLIIEALAFVYVRVVWTHIGGGQQLNILKEKVKSLPKNVTALFLGKQPNEKVREYYIKKTIDVFINVSDSEGVPVSIMEALSAGIPVIATEVGGVSELIDAKVGLLLPRALSPKMLSRAILKFNEFSDEKLLRLKSNALNRYNSLCTAEVCSQKIAKYLIS